MRIYKKGLSALLSICIILTNIIYFDNSNVYAESSNTPTTEYELGITEDLDESQIDYIPDEGFEDETEAAIAAFENLSPEAKELFYCLLTKNDELLDFHVENVEPDFNPEDITTDSVYDYQFNVFSVSNLHASTALASNLVTLNNSLEALNLPSSVLYCFEALAVSVQAAIAEGPLTIGKFVTLIVSAFVVVTIVANWSSVKPKLTKITNIFVKAFSKSASIIKQGFSEISTNSKSFAEEKADISASGNVVTLNGIKYKCETDAEDVSSRERSKMSYCLGVRYNNSVFICTSIRFDLKYARSIIAANSAVVGVFSKTKSQAMSACGGRNSAYGPEIQCGKEKKPGYFYHFHNRFLANPRFGDDSKHGRSHAWFFI